MPQETTKIQENTILDLNSKPISYSLNRQVEISNISNKLDEISLNALSKKSMLPIKPPEFVPMKKPEKDLTNMEDNFNLINGSSLYGGWDNQKFKPPILDPNIGIESKDFFPGVGRFDPRMLEAYNNRDKQNEMPFKINSQRESSEYEANSFGLHQPYLERPKGNLIPPQMFPNYGGNFSEYEPTNQMMYPPNFNPYGQRSNMGMNMYRQMVEQYYRLGSESVYRPASMSMNYKQAYPFQAYNSQELYYPPNAYMFQHFQRPPSKSMAKNPRIEPISFSSNFPEHIVQKMVSSKFEISDLKGYIIKLSRDQNGSRCIQQKLSSCSMEEKLIVYEEIKNEIENLIKDVFGNYIIQKLIELGNLTIKNEIISLILQKTKEFSFDTYGCRVVQCSILHSSHSQKILFVQALKDYIPDCINNLNANHVIQRIIECVDRTLLEDILNYFNQNAYSMALHCYGCRVIQKIIEKCSFEDV